MKAPWAIRSTNAQSQGKKKKNEDLLGKKK